MFTLQNYNLRLIPSNFVGNPAVTAKVYGLQCRKARNIAKTFGRTSARTYLTRRGFAFIDAVRTVFGIGKHQGK